MSPALLLGAVEREVLGGQAVGSTLPATRLLDPLVADRLAVRGQLSDMETIRLWPVQSSWELHDLTFSTFCPHCCLGDLASNRGPIDDSWVPTRDRARGGGGYFRYRTQFVLMGDPDASGVLAGAAGLDDLGVDAL